MVRPSMIHPHKAQMSARNGCASKGDASLDRDGAAETFVPLKRWPDKKQDIINLITVTEANNI
jgi:hypothetical protein